MLIHRIARLRFQRNLLLPKTVLAQSTTCHTARPTGSDLCSSDFDGKNARSWSSKCGGGKMGLKRAERSAPVRFAFIPDNWFLFFYPHTGVTGPYVFGVCLINYLLSKEIYVMEHEYYLGLSIFVVMYYVATNFGTDIGKSLDAEVDAIQKEWEKGRQDDKDFHQAVIQAGQTAQMRANGQKLLMDAKKENIAMQLEAAYRERMMHVYRTTKGLLEYQVKKNRALNKIHQKWMLNWILESVRKAITPEFEQQALDAAIRDLAAAASRA